MDEKIHILLPMCSELHYDVFLNILKNVVGRAKLDTNFLDKAFITGMKTPTVSLHLSDIQGNWSDDHSIEQKIKYVKLLAFWSAHNFPSLGRKLFGEQWEPRQRSVVIKPGELSQASTECQEIDRIIGEKMQLRVVQLDVGLSTLHKIKHFIKVPETVCEGPSFHLTKKMQWFHVRRSEMKNCWKALRFGNFLSSEHLSLDVSYSLYVILFPIYK